MKTIALYLFMLLFSFEASAFETAEKSTGIYQQQFQAGNSATNSQNQNIRSVSWSQVSPSSIDTMDQLPSERRDELATELFIYTLIILVYTFYWYKNKPVD